jgi:hypothetical protein
MVMADDYRKVKIINVTGALLDDGQTAVFCVKYEDGWDREHYVKAVEDTWKRISGSPPPPNRLEAALAALGQEEEQARIQGPLKARGCESPRPASSQGSGRRINNNDKCLSTQRAGGALARLGPGKR